MIYLASPYSHELEQVRHDRYLAARSATEWLFRTGRQVYSPIVYSHHLAGIPGDWEQWGDFDLAMLKHCDSICVLLIEGWSRSRGVAHEMQAARQRKWFQKLLPHDGGGYDLSDSCFGMLDECAAAARGEFADV